MQLRAADIKPGQRIAGSEVVWALALSDRNLVVLGLDFLVPRGKRGTATQTRKYKADEMVDVDPPTIEPPPRDNRG